MIRHIVFFTAREPGNIDSICEGLERLAAIPHALHFEVVRNDKVDLYGNEIDVVVYAEFASQEALFAYKAHPAYAEVTSHVRPLRELRFAADIEAQKRC